MTQQPQTGEGNRVTCKICHYQDYTENKDLCFTIHKGFTIGRGKTLYFMMIWHQSGHVTVFNAEDSTKKRWINGDTEINILWHNTLKNK